MTRPHPLPDTTALIEVGEATWPPAKRTALGAWVIREGRGGGNRVSAATEAWPVTDADLPVAERAMRALGQVPLFQIREGDDKLDALLERHGYVVRDPTNLWAAATAPLAKAPFPPATIYTMWPPLELVRDIWADAGIGEARQAVMERARCDKTAILARSGDHAAGVAYAAIHDGVAMLHALYVKPSMRREGVGGMIVRAAAKWALNRGAQTLGLMVTQANHEANPLYADLGMSRLGRYHYRVHPQG